ncbi:MAG TPA: amidohydrolase family protein [Chthoniobacterales bacterium]|nr:amidohydrolase family protein [Chthoniobacterales bacterium]
MIIRARTVVPMEGPPIENGAVAVDGSRIAAVGGFDEVRSTHAGDVTDLGESILLPGLVNAHCHLDYTALRGRITPKESFAGWIRAINAEKAKLTDEDYIESIRAGFSEAVRFGTTTIANLTAFPRLIGAIAEPIRTWWFGELIDVRNPADADEIVEETVEALKAAERWGLAPHAPFTASAWLYARCEEIAERTAVPLTTHLAESRDEMRMFRDGTGPAFDFLKEIGRSMDDCGNETPLSLFLRNRTAPARWIVAHLNELDAADFELLANAPKFPIVHCPRSHAFFGHEPFALERLCALGFNVCLGTDSLASNSDLSLFSEMRELIRKHPAVTARQALEMATINGARALRQRDIGAIRPGAFADLIALPDTSGRDPFEKIVAFEGTIPWMMVNGQSPRRA